MEGYETELRKRRDACLMLDDGLDAEADRAVDEFDDSKIGLTIPTMANHMTRYAKWTGEAKVLRQWAKWIDNLLGEEAAERVDTLAEREVDRLVSEKADEIWERHHG